MEAFDAQGNVNREMFASQLITQLDDFNAVLQEANKTSSPQVESTHLLFALWRKGDYSKNFFAERGLQLVDTEEYLSACLTRVPDATPISELSRTTMSQSALDVIRALTQLEAAVSEPWLLLTILQNLPDNVVNDLHTIGIRQQDMIDDLKRNLPPIEMVELNPFDEQGDVQLDVFSSGGQRVLQLMMAEAMSLGFEQMDPRHLLLGLLAFEGGATHVLLHQQNLFPRKVQEYIMASFQGQNRTPQVEIALNTTFMDLSVIQILKDAGQIASRKYDGKIAEVHIVQAFLELRSFARRQLENFKSDEGQFDLNRARQIAQNFRPEDEVAIKDKTMQTWDQVEKELNSVLIGQDDAVQMCKPFIRRMLFDYRRSGRPIGVFLFCGPSGTGKTELAKAIARAVYGSEENLIMLEMGQFQTKESMSIFVGAPPGYIGFGQGKLTNGLRAKPKSVVLFDEVEKADDEVFDALLRFLDEGKIDDPAGPVRDGTGCIIVMTSNVDTRELQERLQGGAYNKNKMRIRSQLRESLLNLTVPHDETGASRRKPFRFRPEFLNRIDEIILFRRLNSDDYAAIAERCLAEEQQRLAEKKDVHITFGDGLQTAAAYFGPFCEWLDEGARAVPRTIQNAIVDPVIDFVLNNEPKYPVYLEVEVVKPETPEDEPQGTILILD